MRRCSATDKVRFVSVLRIDAENDPLHPLHIMKKQFSTSRWILRVPARRIDNV